MNIIKYTECYNRGDKRKTDLPTSLFGSTYVSLAVTKPFCNPLFTTSYRLISVKLSYWTVTTSSVSLATTVTSHPGSTAWCPLYHRTSSRETWQAPKPYWNVIRYGRIIFLSSRSCRWTSCLLQSCVSIV